MSKPYDGIVDYNKLMMNHRTKRTASVSVNSDKATVIHTPLPLLYSTSIKPSIKQGQLKVQEIVLQNNVKRH